MPKFSQLQAQSPATIDAMFGIVSPVFNVKRYGAVCDGVTNDATAVQAAITACEAAGGGIVQFPAGTCFISTGLTVTGATQTDGFDRGGVVLRGVSPRATKLKTAGGITAVTFVTPSRMMCQIEDMEIVGPGSGTANSRGMFWDGTGGNAFFKNVYIHDFATGAEWYDATLSVWTNVAVRLCGTGIKTTWNQDIHTFIGCRFDYNSTGIHIGSPTGSHPSGSQENNCLSFIGCRVSNNTTRGIFVDDLGCSGVKFDTCYFESNQKEAEIGVSGRVDATAPIGITFDGCYFTPVTTAPVAIGFDVFNGALLSFKDCKTDGANRYTIFLKLADETLGGAEFENCQILAATATVQYGGRNYLDTNAKFETLRVGRAEIESHSGSYLPASGVWKVHGLAAGTGKTWDAWRRLNSATGATLAEMQMYDTGGVMRFSGVGSTPGYICATSIAALPTAGVNYRGAFAYVPGNGTSTADVLSVCLLSAAGTYSWKTIVSG